MSTETHFGTSAGPVNSGTGEQHNHFYRAIRDAVRETPPRPPRRVAEDAVLHLKQRFVHPEGWPEAAELLERSNVVLLSAKPGSGARSMARMLLLERPRSQGHLLELVDQSEEEGRHGHALDPTQVEGEASLLLDLTRTRRDRYQVFMQELSSFRVMVREKQARLAVVLAPEYRTLLDEELAELVTYPSRPNADEVLRRHLLVQGIRPTQEEGKDGKLTEFLTNSSMSDIAELARQIRRARDTSANGTGFKCWLNIALTTMLPDHSDVGDVLTHRTTSPERALLVTVAFLQGASSRTIYSAADRLLSVTGHTQQHAPLLRHLPLNDRLNDIKARAAGETGEVQFSNRMFAEAVRAFFWDNFPQLRPRLSSWIVDAVNFSGVERETLLTLVTRYATECLRTGPPNDLSNLAEEWTEESATQVQLSMAARALGNGVTHQRHGSHFRQKIYTWSRDGSLPHGRANVLIGVCSEALAVDFPQQALVRLHHLSHRNDQQVRDSAREALARITTFDDHLYGHLLNRLRDRVRADPEGDGRHDTVTFLRIAGPDRLLGDTAAEERLIALWAAAFGGHSQEEWAPPFGAWLDEACSGAGPESPVIDVLAEACARDIRTLGRVHHAAITWAGADSARRRVADALWNRAITALGIHPSVFTC